MKLKIEFKTILNYGPFVPKQYNELRLGPWVPIFATATSSF